MPDPAARPAPGLLPPPVASGPTPGDEFNRLVEIMRALRSPAGCPWDHEQTFRTLAPYVQEEAAEVVDAIERDDPAGICEEVGDLVFEGVFLAQVGAEHGQFTAVDALRAVCEKLIRRHPHVFAQPAPAGASDEAVETPHQVKDQWARIKAREKEARTGRRPHLLDQVPRSLPALSGAFDIGRKVARVGFDWPSPGEVLDKIEEEIGELRAELVPSTAGARAAAPPSAASGAGAAAPAAPGAGESSPAPAQARIAEELGDLLFSVAQLARALGLDPEAALREANRKFRRR
nr:MazG family protein [Vicinamibacterales bacterium]